MESGNVRRAVPVDEELIKKADYSCGRAARRRTSSEMLPPETTSAVGLMSEPF